MKRFTILSLFIISTALLLADLLTSLEINCSIIYSTSLFISLISLFLILDVIYLKNKVKKFNLFAFSASLFISLVVFALFPSQWQTQTLLYKHGHFSLKTIEFQMQDIGSRGYNKRIVERTKILPGISLIELKKDTSTISLPWIKSNIEINELGLKY